MIRHACLAMLMLALASGIAGDVASGMRLYRVYFLGSKSPGAQRAYEIFMDAVSRTQPGLAAAASFTLWDMDAYGTDADGGIRSAMAMRPDLLVALNGYYAAAAARNAGATPVVFSSYEDPVRYGIVTDMNSRREPICGVSLADTLEGKRLEILQQAFPGIRSVAVIADQSWAGDLGGRERIDEEARRLGLSISILVAESRADVQAALSSPEAARFDAWYVPATHLSDDADTVVFERLRAWQKPAIWASSSDVDRGAQMAYAQETEFVWASAAELVSRVRQGERAGSIPILRPTRFTLVVRMTPANDMPMPDISVVRRADVVRR